MANPSIVLTARMRPCFRITTLLPPAASPVACIPSDSDTEAFAWFAGTGESARAESARLVVVEAAESSVALITARSAVEQGRPVLAVPGPIARPLQYGPHRMIQQGARLVMTVAEMPPGTALVFGELA